MHPPSTLPRVLVHTAASADWPRPFGAPSCGSIGRCYTPGRTGPVGGVEMLDAYIINRIRRERESREPARQRPRIEMPMHDRWSGPEPRVDDRRRERDAERGVAIIDFTI